MSQKVGVTCPYCGNFVQFEITSTPNADSSSQCPKCHKSVHVKTDSNRQLKELSK
jgi:endogenous inhibitor of DNA gyrase (YacG/DUF329 family)